MRLIDADRLVEEINNHALEKLSKGGSVLELGSYAEGLVAARNLVYNAETVDAVKHGHWIHGSSSENIKVTCSECGYKVNYFWDSWQDAKFCPNCGAKMDGDANA